MNDVSLHFRVGTRSSKLALIQATEAIQLLAERLPGLTASLYPFSSPGDRDPQRDLRESPADFFTRDLDDAVRAGLVDLAVHSAKDMPDPAPDGLDWFWLPGGKDPREVWVYPRGKSRETVPPSPRIGVSSDRRADLARRRYPQTILLPIRGTIEERLAQLDAGAFDALLMAGAALLRLGLESRIGEWIPEEELPPPAGQGVLGITFRKGDRRLMRLRQLFIYPVVFVGAGVGRASLCTVEGITALQEAEVCFYEELLDPTLLEVLPSRAERVAAGRRAGSPLPPQEGLHEALMRRVRRGKRVVWLKGGDPGLFGRLGEITQTLAEWGLPFRVIPGVSSLTVATTGTGFLLTRRGVRETFLVTTGQKAEGCIPSWGSSKALQVAMVLFMARQKVSQLTARLMAEGWPPSTPATAVLGAGSPSEQIIETTLHELPHHLTIQTTQAPALLLVNMPADFRFTKEGGPLAGARVLLTCSRTVMKRAEQAVRRYGGVPVPCPLVRPVLAAEGSQAGDLWEKGDTLLLTSPSAVEILLNTLRQRRCDIRTLPALVTWGSQTAAALEARGLYSIPLADLAATALPSANRRRLLWLRSDQANRSVIVTVARQAGWSVEERVLYRNEPVQVSRWPPGESVLFLSGSAVRSWMDQRGSASLKELTVGAFPGSAQETLKAFGRTPDVVAPAATIDALVAALAARSVTQTLHEEMPR